MHSWRVLILPFVEQQELYDKYRFDEPWDGPNNSKLLSQMPDCFSCPSHGHHGEKVGDFHSNYVAIVGSETAFPNDQMITFEDIEDGSSNTVFCTCVNSDSVCWMQPEDISDRDFVALNIRSQVHKDDSVSNHPGIIHVIWADGSVQAISLKVSTFAAKAITTINGGEDLDGVAIP